MKPLLRNPLTAAAGAACGVYLAAARYADILSRRLSPSEVSYARNLGFAGTVYRGAIENMKDVAIGLRNLDGIAKVVTVR